MQTLESVGVLVILALVLMDRVMGWLKGRGVDLQKMAAQIETAERNVAATRVDVARLVTMHEHPEDYNFGNRRTHELLESQIAATNALTEVVRDLVNEIRLERELRRASSRPQRVRKTE